MRYTKQQVEKQLEKVCRQADEALRNEDMQKYWQLSNIRTGLRVALGHVNQNRDHGDIRIDPEFLEALDGHESNDMGENKISDTDEEEPILDDPGETL